MHARARTRTRQPRLEILEDRRLLATITVDTTADGYVPASAITLREAIQIADGLVPISSLSPMQQALVHGAYSVPNTIVFAIAGTGVRSIQPLTPLPTITAPTIINGYTQPGSTPNTLAVGDNAKILIQLDGQRAGTGNGLVFTAGNSEVEGLAIDGWGTSNSFKSTTQGDGLLFSGTNGGNVVWGNFIGVDPTGTIGEPNANYGVVFSHDTASDSLGGTQPAARNVIQVGDVGINQQFGVEIDHENNPYVLGNEIGTNAAGTNVPIGQGAANATGLVLINVTGATIGAAVSGAGNVIEGIGIGSDIPTVTNGYDRIEGNRIGTDAAGLHSIGGGSSGYFGGISVDNSLGNVIGGTAPGAGNIIAAEGVSAITLRDGGLNSVLGTVVEGNHINTNVTETLNFGTAIGITIFQSSGNAIGDIAPGAGNVIAYTTKHGIELEGGIYQGNKVLGNSIHGTGLAGIDSPGSTGETFSIAAAYPVATGLLVQGGMLTSALPQTAYVVEFFATPSGPGSSQSGQTFLGRATFVTDKNGKSASNIILPVSVTPGEVLTATVTGPSDNTAGFFGGVTVSSQPVDGMTFTAYAAMPLAGQPVNLSAAFTTNTSALGLPTGQVTFTDGSTILGKAAIDSTGHAMLTTTSLGPGTHQLYAVYPGDSIYTGLSSGPVLFTIQGAPPTVLGAQRLSASSVLVSFSEAMDPTSAGDAVNYQIVALRSTKQGLVPTGPVINVSTASYNASTAQVVLTPAARLVSNMLYRLTIMGVTDRFGTVLSGGIYAGQV